MAKRKRAEPLAMKEIKARRKKKASKKKAASAKRSATTSTKRPPVKRKKRPAKKPSRKSAKKKTLPKPASGGGGDSAEKVPAPPPVLSSGIGDDPKHVRGDLQMIERSAAKRWPTSDQVKQALLTKVSRIGLASEDPRVIVAATRAYLQAEKQNQADDLKQKPDRVVHEYGDTVITTEQQRIAALRAIAAEKRKRARRKRD